MRAALARWPLWALGVACLVVTSGGFALFLWLVVPDAGAAGVLGGGAGFGAPTTMLAVAGLGLWRQRRPWTREEWVKVNRAFGTGRPPATTELDERLLATIRVRRRTWRRARRYAPWASGALIAAAVVNTVTGHLATGLSPVITGSMCFVFAIVLPSAYLRRLDDLETALIRRRRRPGRAGEERS